MQEETFHWHSVTGAIDRLMLMWVVTRGSLCCRRQCALLLLVALMTLLSAALL